MPLVRDLLVEVDDAVVRAMDEHEVGAAIARRGADLVIVARDPWTEEDTELCRRLHALESALPILAVGGGCDVAVRAAALRAGADDFLAVPFEVEELVARTFALVRRASTASRYARAGALSVDFMRRQIFLEGVSVPLTLREYDLLAKLIERAGEVVTRRELAGLTASAKTESESNTVDVHMSRVRDKLDKHASDIETVRGIGYRLRRS